MLLAAVASAQQTPREQAIDARDAAYWSYGLHPDDPLADPPPASYRAKRADAYAQRQNAINASDGKDPASQEYEEGWADVVAGDLLEAESRNIDPFNQLMSEGNTLINEGDQLAGAAADAKYTAARDKFAAARSIMETNIGKVADAHAAYNAAQEHFDDAPDDPGI